MDLTQLNPDTLRELIKLTEQKSLLLKQIDAIDARINAVGSGKSSAPKAAPEKSGKRRGRPPGAKAPKAPKAPKASKAPKAEKAPKAPKPPKATGKRGALKNDILKLLSEAGPEGASVKDISSQLGVKNQNVHVWFSTTGKKLAEISKVGEARYAFAAPNGSSPRSEAPVAPEATHQTEAALS